MKRYICIHCHFYQPPRENPWLEAVELQDSAHPWHDWNKRITEECYAANANSRIFDDQGRIAEIVNNYAKISFNFGPTLLAWLEKETPEVFKAILDADKESQEAFSGHGSALAQAYNHMILPLANSRDKYTQVLWGIRDFEQRFRRKPEGMWLPETAVNLETLEVLAELGIRFTILAPNQAKRFRPIGHSKWTDVSGAKIDPTRAYLLNLSSGRSIALFFYDGPISRAVGFEGLLSKGESFVERLLGGFSHDSERPQLLHIATDGETYGHHHRFGDLTLAYALQLIESQNTAHLTNYGEYLEKYPPTHEVEVFQNSSWSCIHGVERWRSDCGCNSGNHPGWHQGWRAPLKEALDWLRDILSPAYGEKAGLLLKDPWKARDDYIQVVLDRSHESIERFLSQHATRVLSEAEKVAALELLEMQRNAMLMYTSCGWFFDDISAIEAVQVMQFAARVLQLSKKIFGNVVEPRFLELLERAKSNIPLYGSGRRIYEESVKPTIYDLEKIGAQYAITSLFEDHAERSSIYCYTAERESHESSKDGGAKLVLGCVKLTSEITRESTRLCFGALTSDDYSLNCRVGAYSEKHEDSNWLHEIREAFAAVDFPKTLKLMARHIGASSCSLKSLAQDQQRKILAQILKSTLKEAETVYSQLYERLTPIMGVLNDLNIPAPKVFHAAAELSLSARLRRAFENDEPRPELIEALLEEARREGVSLEANGLEHSVKQRLGQIGEEFYDSPAELHPLQKLNSFLSLTSSLPFPVSLWKIQNLYYDTLQTVYPKIQERAEKGNKRARKWMDHFTILGEKLSVRVVQKRYTPTLSLFPHLR
jgi:alpha-amylase/alpha-mannosidase (GH57 family)